MSEVERALAPEAGTDANDRRGFARASGRSALRLLVGLLLAFGLGAAVSLIPLPYAVLSPGPATDVLGAEQRAGGTTVDRIVISGHESFPTSGSLDFTTVRVTGGPGYPVNAVDVLSAWLDRDRDVFPADAIFPPEATREQVAEENRVEMTSSQESAAAVAVRALGYQVTEVITVARVSDGAPAAAELKAGDVLVSIAGSPVPDNASVRAEVQQVKAGETVEMVVERGGAQVTVNPRTGAAADGRTILGVVLGVDYRMPFQVTIDAGNVGGPSAGLMFALGVYDRLTPGALTGGKAVAGTGTISATGAVGAIDGIPQKMVGARQAGAEYFLAPAGNCADLAERSPDGLSVVKVESFDQARLAVEAIGRGDSGSLPRC